MSALLQILEKIGVPYYLIFDIIIIGVYLINMKKLTKQIKDNSNAAEERLQISVTKNDKHTNEKFGLRLQTIETKISNLNDTVSELKDDIKDIRELLIKHVSKD